MSKILSTHTHRVREETFSGKKGEHSPPEIEKGEQIYTSCLRLWRPNMSNNKIAGNKIKFNKCLKTELKLIRGGKSITLHQAME